MNFTYFLRFLIRKIIIISATEFYKKNSSKNTAPQQTTAVLNKSAPNQAASMPITNAAAPDTGLCVAFTIAGKVMTDKVT